MDIHKMYQPLLQSLQPLQFKAQTVKGYLVGQLEKHVMYWNSHITYGISYDIQSFINLKNELLEKIKNIIIIILNNKFIEYNFNVLSKSKQRFNVYNIIHELIERFVAIFSYSIKNNIEEKMRNQPSEPELNEFAKEELYISFLLHEIYFCIGHRFNFYKYIDDVSNLHSDFM
jgi:hypothetical protein